jgi:murein L,D-transpeptidase YcbB/YkuD
VPALRKRLAATGDLPSRAASDQSQMYDKQTVEAVQRFQRLHFLEPDGVVDDKTVETLNVPVEQRIDQILVNLERSRWIIKPDEDTTVIVNIAGFKLYYSGPNNSSWETRVVVGKPYRESPVFESRIDKLIFNPSWIVPPTILKEDILPKVKKNPRYLRKHGFRVYRKSPYTLAQAPGPKNPMGRVKFTFTNPYDIYLHDTPDKKLFNRPDRTASSGCIRVEGALDLAQLLLTPHDVPHDKITRMLHSRKTVNIALKPSIPVLILYWTVEVLPDGAVMFIPDVYGRDGEILEVLHRRLAGTQSSRGQ